MIEYYTSNNVTSSGPVLSALKSSSSPELYNEINCFPYSQLYQHPSDIPCISCFQHYIMAYVLPLTKYRILKKKILALLNFHICNHFHFLQNNSHLETYNDDYPDPLATYQTIQYINLNNRTNFNRILSNVSIDGLV